MGMVLDAIDALQALRTELDAMPSAAERVSRIREAFWVEEPTELALRDAAAIVAVRLRLPSKTANPVWRMVVQIVLPGLQEQRIYDYANVLEVVEQLGSRRAARFLVENGGFEAIARARSAQRKSMRIRARRFRNAV